jgi:haloalkane dehalogenase
MAYRRTASSGGPTAVLVHGIPGSGAAWSQVASHLADRFDVIVPDLLGFGGSARPTGLADLHAQSQARALSGLLDELPLEGVIVAGHDFGGPVALALHAQRPDLVAAVALLATNAFTDTPIPFPLSTVTWPLVGRAFSRVVFSSASQAMMLRFGVGRPRIRLDASTHLGDRSQRRAIRTIFSGSLTNLAELYRPIEDGLHRIAIPVMVAWGDRDPFFSIDQGQRTAAAVGAELQVYQGAGHFLPEERPAEVADDLALLAAAIETG